MAKATRNALLAALVAGLTALPLARADSPATQTNTKIQSTQQAAAAAQAQQAATQPAAAAIRAGTQVTAELQSTVDTRNAKPNDEVVARVTKNVKQDGRIVLHRGDRLASPRCRRPASRMQARGWLSPSIARFTAKPFRN